MRLGEILRLVWLNIVANRSKVLLTSLGIIVGSATIVLVLAIGRGGQADVADQFKNLNAGAIDVEAVTAQQAGPGAGGPAGGPAAPPAGGPPAGGPGRAARPSNRQSNVVTLTADDVEDIADLVPGLDEVTILIQGNTTILGGRAGGGTGFHRRRGVGKLSRRQQSFDAVRGVLRR
ncbi:MAG: hypothetical protein DBX44_07070 [Oscillospiraceae bacterium]|nr:MAG: hypothetical protein DBX44_07070 [Oscillospiraceae bacterium]